MIDKKSLDLINRDIDGMTSPDEHSLLQSRMAVEPELQKLHNELQRLSRAMAESKPVDPPPSLKHAILRAIQPAAPKRSLAGRLSAMTTPGWVRQKGPAFAIGVLLGVLLYGSAISLLRNPPERESDLSGTLLPRESLQNLGSPRTFDLSGAGVTGSLRTSGDRDLSLIHLNLQASAPIIAELTFDPRAVEFRALSPGKKGGAEVEIHAGSITIRGTRVEDLAAVFGHEGSSSPQIRLILRTQEDDTIVDRTLPLAPEK
jgi:hypothetical protein